MEFHEFDQILDEQLARCRATLMRKAEEYSSSDDRLRNFRLSAALSGVSMRHAVAGMMAKHTTSIYDMCGSEQPHSMGMWEEKITDHINYLILLYAVLDEEARGYSDA
jgi:hypothetical protein